MTTAISKFGLPSTHKILKADAYASALRMRVCAKVGVFALHFCAHKPHGLTQAHPQLGLVIPKKFAKHAIRRNTLKRLSREYFRLNQYQLAQGLWVLRLNTNVNNLVLCSKQKRLWAIQIVELFTLGQIFAKQYTNGC